MASFRTGFKIFGELSIKQGLGRIRSFSEDRKPGQWLPEDQWAVRQPGSTCPEPCDKPKKPPKPSKSWLSVCSKEPRVPQECDIRHNNCPPPPAKPDGPWYSLDNLIPKKKPEKPPPLGNCRDEMKRRELFGEKEEVCEKIVDRTFIVDIKPEPSDCCAPKPEPSPAPVIPLTSSVPKDLVLMFWCEKPSMDTSKLPIKCQSDKLPYQEFRPQKIWKPSPFSLPNKSDPPSLQPFGCQIDPIPFAEFKQVEVPKPMYTRYKSVELSDCNFLMSMIDVKCPENGQKQSMAITPVPNPKIAPQPVEVCKKKDGCPEKPLIKAGSCRPVRLKNAPKYTFRPKPTKLIEKRVVKNPCAQHKSCDSEFRHEERETGENEFGPAKSTSTCEPPKIITGTLTSEPQTYERNFLLSNNPPKWMYFLSKPGSKDTPLIPSSKEYPEEPDWSSETDGLNFYDGNDEGLHPKPPPYPCTEKPVPAETVTLPVFDASTQPEVDETDSTQFKNRFVLMPECFNIRKTRIEDSPKDEPDSSAASFEQFIEAKTVTASKCAKSYPPMKENILYDLQRLCPNAPFDPTKFNAPCRKPPKQDCLQPTSNHRYYSTLSPATFRKVRSAEFFEIQRRTECGDSRGKCKVRPLVPKSKECPEKPKMADCAEITLPCCPKSRIPPSCNIRRPMKPCKKKLAPKPSFSECNKDPPPCPKITECNCWDVKPGKKK